MPILIRNRAQCPYCLDTIESHTRHDFVTCECGNLSVDGGHDYLKRSIANTEYAIIELSESYPLFDEVFGTSHPLHADIRTPMGVIERIEPGGFCSVCLRCTDWIVIEPDEEYICSFYCWLRKP